VHFVQGLIEPVMEFLTKFFHSAHDQDALFWQQTFVLIEIFLLKDVIKHGSFSKL
jgi:hypothetical protein